MQFFNLTPYLIGAMCWPTVGWRGGGGVKKYVKIDYVIRAYSLIVIKSLYLSIDNCSLIGPQINRI